MAARLGHVLGWAGDIVGGLLMLMGAYFGAVATVDKLTTFLLLFVPGFTMCLIGRACRYVLAGEEERGKKRFINNTSELIILLLIVGGLFGAYLNKGFTMAAIF